MLLALEVDESNKLFIFFLDCLKFLKLIGRSSSDKNPTLASYAAAAGKQPGTDIGKLL